MNEGVVRLAKSLYCRIRQLFWRVPEASARDGKLKLHLGCGTVNTPGYVNIDVAPMSHVHLVQKIDRLARFKSNSVDFIYASHVLEHISHRETIKVLQEWKRVLKPGGLLRLSVPDFDALLQIYGMSQNHLPSIERMLFGGQDYPGNAHFAAFNFDHIRSLLVQAGFEEPVLWGPIYDQEPFCCDHSCFETAVNGAKLLVSLNVEAICSR
jgi:predicted SAM-dependent methyltransferase